MTVPPWALGVMLAFALGQFALVAMWMMRADRRLALIEATLIRLTVIMDRHSLEVIASDIARLKHESDQHKAAHGRNRQRIEDVHRQALDLYATATAHRTPRTEG